MGGLQDETGSIVRTLIRWSDGGVGEWSHRKDSQMVAVAYLKL